MLRQKRVEKVQVGAAQDRIHAPASVVGPFAQPADKGILHQPARREADQALLDLGDRRLRQGRCLDVQDLSRRAEDCDGSNVA